MSLVTTSKQDTRGHWTADEVPESVLVLASDKASFNSGHGLVIDGSNTLA